jgi:ribonuclease P protein component
MPTHGFRARHRIGLDADYKAAFANRLSKSRGPLIVFLNPNGQAEHRLGLSIGRRVGGAVTRVRLKRMIRESFRLDRPVYPLIQTDEAYDIVVSARSHNPLTLNEYRRHLRDAVEAADREHRKRAARTDRSDS